jgi:cobyrinic acid a,c-diamide synthase
MGRDEPKARSTTPALIVAGTHSGCGKTTVTLAILAALVRRGLRVQGFKVGPDFIDPGHHSAITGRTSRNLDTWLLNPATLAQTYRRATPTADIAIVEGVMGLFDGRGALDETGSTADLARLWELPVVLVVDAKGLARSIAPLVRGYAHFDEHVRIVGAITNRVGSRRHYEEYLAPALGSDAVTKPLGFLVRDDCLTIPSRHLGLQTADELRPGSDFLDALADAAEATLNLDRILDAARAPSLAPEPQLPSFEVEPSVRIAVARDPAFCFYYEDNFDCLREAGAEIVLFSPLADSELPHDCALVYLGGGYPELFAERIASNTPMCEAIRSFHAEGGLIFAECGGMMACSRSIRDHSGREFPMWDLIPLRVVMQPKLSALGYVTVVTDLPSALGPVGTAIRGHEFHYSRIEPLAPLTYVTSLHRLNSGSHPDAVASKGLVAGYAHMHFGSNRDVARNLVAAALQSRSKVGV